jgi:hypothetical protein
VLPGEEGHPLNPVVKLNPDGNGGTVTKIGIDATVPHDGDKAKFERVEFKRVDLARYDIRSARVRATATRRKP